MVLIANGGARTPSGALAHFLAAYTPTELSLAKSDYLRPPASPGRYGQVQPRSSLSLRGGDSVDSSRHRLPQQSSYSYTRSVHTLRRQARTRSPPSPPSPVSPVSPTCDCLPVDPIPPPELFDF